MARRAAVGLAIALALAGCGELPTVVPLPAGTTSGVATTGPTDIHTPVPGELWQAGSSLALPCAGGGTVSPNTLLRAGPIRTAVEHYTSPTIVLRPGGRIDLSDGVLGVSGGDYVSESENAGSPKETTYATVPKGIGVVTIARFWDAALDTDPRNADFAGAELRLSDTQPVRWEERGFAGTDIATAAWFGKAARERFAATGYDPFDQLDDQGRAESDVTSFWESDCHFFDVAPREVDGVHDVILIITNGDGGFTQYLGYDAAGRVCAAVILGYVDWKALGLPGTPPK